MKIFYLILGSFILLGCASTQSTDMITLTPDGRYEVVGLSGTKEGAMYEAKSQANQYCRKEKKMVMIDKEESIYQGILPDKVSKIGGLTMTDFKTTLEFECK
jgi:hypothetical protein